MLKRSAISQCWHKHTTISQWYPWVWPVLYTFYLWWVFLCCCSAIFHPALVTLNYTIVKQHISLPLTWPSVQCTDLFTCVQIPQLYMTVQTARCCHCLQQIKLKISMTIMSLWYQATIIIIYRYFIEMRCIVWSKWVSFPLLRKNMKNFSWIGTANHLRINYFKYF